jgi:hypothetical protein
MKTYVKPWAIPVFAAVLAAAGCTDGDGKDKPKSSPNPANSGAASPQPAAPPVRVTVADLAAATKLAHYVALAPQDWGTGFKPRARYESSGQTWGVLDNQCTWMAATLPPSVHVSFARYAELPAPAGGPTGLQVHTLVTVHKDVDSAKREITESAAETKRCPQQKFGPGAEVGGMQSAVNPSTTPDADEVLVETGRFVRPIGAPQRSYVWTTARIGQVTVSAWIAGAENETPEQTQARAAQALTAMSARVAAPR